MTRIRSRLVGVAKAIRSPDAATSAGPGAGPGATGAASAFLPRYASLLPDWADQTVVILADDAAAPVPDHLEVPLAGRRIVVSPEAAPGWSLEQRGVEHRGAQNLDQVNWHLRFFGPVDVIVDLAARSGREYDEVWRKLVFHLRPRGAYVIDRSRATDTELPPSLLAGVATIGLTGPDLPQDAEPDRARRVAIMSVTVDADHVVMIKRGKHILKTKDRLASRILPEREPDLSTAELVTLPGGVLEARCRIHSHDAAVPIPYLETRMDYPDHHLRHYRGEIAMVSNGLMHTGFSALPESFRHHNAYSPTNPRLLDASGDFARTRPVDRPTRELPGSYFHLDSENPGHYGHLMTEVVSRLWGWDQAKREIPDLKAVFRIRYEDERVPVLEQRVLGAYGIATEDVVWVHEPVWLESVVGATPMFHNQVPHYVHPDLLGVWDRLRDSFLAEAAATEGGIAGDFGRSGGQRIFVSRQDITANRSCRNTRDVEAFFAGHGYDVVYPELYDLAQQAAIFDRAEVIAGFGGSAMFNVMFSRGHRAVILLNHEAYTARNEHLYLALLGGDVHYFWSTPDVSHPVDGWSREAYYSSWAFDFERNTDALTDVITGLG
jgi:capsular polysaccharide biosynthesis protein